MVTAIPESPLTSAEVLRFVARLQASDIVVDAAAGIDLISALETVKCVSVATQAVVTDAVATVISTERRERGKPKAQWRKGMRRRSAWLDESHPTAAALISGLLVRSFTKCHTPWPA